MSQSPPIVNRHWRAGRAVVAALAAGAFLAACQNQAPTATFGLDSDKLSLNPHRPLVKINAAGGETFFTLALPPEPNLPKEVQSFYNNGTGKTVPLSQVTTSVVAAIIPNQKGFIIEGARLNNSRISYNLGSTKLIVRKMTPNQVIVEVPRTVFSPRGILSVRYGAVVLARTAVDARNVYVNGRAVIRFREGTPKATLEKALLAAGAKHYRYAGMNFLVAYYDLSKDWKDVEPVFRAQSVFEDVTRDTLYVPRSLPQNEPNYGDQWYLPKINAPSGWSVTAGSPDEIVAILDTGVQKNHPDLSRNIFTNSGETPGNGIDDDGNGRIDDVNGWNAYDGNGDVSDLNGHGTQMAGVVAATANGKGGAGIAYNARIIPIKVANDEGVATSSTLIDGINYAVRNRASVLSISVASKINDPAVKSAVEFATTFNCSVVAAMGNDGARVLEFPAGWSKEIPLIAVGATNSVDARPSWGNYGDWMTVSAPGENIFTTDKGSAYTKVSGTSPATALTAGFAAMIKSLKPGYTPAMVRDMIQSGAVDLGDPGFDWHFGHGRINLAGAFDEVAGDVLIDASSQHQTLNFPPDRALDKNTETYWSSARRSTESPEWLTLDLGLVRTVSSVAAMSAPWYSFLFPADFTIETSQDGSSWTTVASEADFKIGESEWRSWSFAPIQARYVRMNITRSRENPDNNLFYSQVAEFVVNGEENAIVKNSSSAYYGVAYSSNWLTDKNPNTFWVSAPRKSNTREFAIADMGYSQTIKSIDLLCPPPIISEAFPKTFSLWVSNDKNSWQLVKDVRNERPINKTWFHYPIAPTTARYIRIDVSETNRANSHGSLYGGFGLTGYTAAIAEVEVNRPVSSGRAADHD